LPQYLQRFDICLNPLAVTEQNNRRSLLRFYDYLATDKPILSTALKEAEEHETHVRTARTLDEFTSLLRSMLDGSCFMDLKARREYIQKNTWQTRASALWTRIAGTSPTSDLRGAKSSSTR
jgi:hypothetical protein